MRENTYGISGTCYHSAIGAFISFSEFKLNLLLRCYFPDEKLPVTLLCICDRRPLYRDLQSLRSTIGDAMAHQLVTHTVRLLTIGSSEFDITDDSDAGADAFPAAVDRELKPLLQGLARVSASYARPATLFDNVEIFKVLFVVNTSSGFALLRFRIGNTEHFRFFVLCNCKHSCHSFTLLLLWSRSVSLRRHCNRIRSDS
jgi:hypothetical protein